VHDFLQSQKGPNAGAGALRPLALEEASVLLVAALAILAVNRGRCELALRHCPILAPRSQVMRLSLA